MNVFWLVVLTIGIMGADGKIEPKEEVMSVAFASKEDCEIHAPELAIAQIPKIEAELADGLGYLIKYRCVAQGVTEKAVWKTNISL